MKIPLALAFDDVLLVPQKSEIESRNQVDLTTRIAPNFPLSIPLIAINMDSVTGTKMSIAMSQEGGVALMPRFDSSEIMAEKIAEVKSAGQKVIAALGLRDDYLVRAEKCVRAGADGLTIDVAHGHMAKCLRVTAELKSKFGLPLSAGVVATYEGALDLFNAGADAVRVGLGVGTICTTRIMTGFGVPQMTAILEAARARKKFPAKFILADGGTSNSGDIVKVLAAGADAVICGSLLAGTDEAPGEIIEREGKFYKEYNASTSETEKSRQMAKYNGHKEHFKLHVEGVESLVQYKGPLSAVIDSLCAGIRSGFSYCGAKNITELHQKARFIQITGAGMAESLPHDVEVIHQPAHINGHFQNQRKNDRLGITVPIVL